MKQNELNKKNNAERPGKMCIAIKIHCVFNAYNYTVSFEKLNIFTAFSQKKKMNYFKTTGQFRFGTFKKIKKHFKKICRFYEYV